MSDLPAPYENRNAYEKLFPFASTDHRIRYFLIDGKLWFVAMDVCAALGLGNTPAAVSRVKTEYRSSIILNDRTSSGGNPNVTIISEPGLYKLIGRSDKPEAEAFMDWVYEEVLPSIRETGSYALDSAIDPKDAAVIRALDQIANRVESGFQQQNQQFDLFGKRMGDVESRLDRVESAVKETKTICQEAIPPRKPFGEKTRRLFDLVIVLDFGGYCPVKRHIRLFDSNGNRIKGLSEYDHWQGSDDNQSGNGWLISKQANQEFRNRAIKMQAEPSFRHFQSCRKHREKHTGPGLFDDFDQPFDQ